MTRQAYSARVLFSFAFLASFALACSSGGGSGGGSDSGVSKLSPEQQQAYQAWLKAPIKSCQAIEVVGGGTTTFSDGPEGGPMVPGFPGGFPTHPRSGQNAIEKGLDLKVLADRTGGSLWLSNVLNPGFFALLSGGATGFTSGSSTSKFEQSVSVNGSAQSVKVETTSSGFDCVVKINDVQVAQVSIAKSVDLALAGSGSVKFKDLAIPLKDAWQSYEGVTVVPVSAWMRAVDSTLRQPETAAALAVGLGYSESEAKKYFVVRGSNANGAFGLEFASAGAKVAFAGDSEIVLDSSQFKQLPDVGQTKTVSIVSMYRTGGLSIGGVRFGADSNDVMVVRQQVSVSNAAGTVTIQDLGNRSMMAMSPTVEMTDACVSDRVANYSTLYKSKLRMRQQVELPTRRLLFGACEPLEPELQTRYNRSDLALRSLNVLLSGVSRDLVQATGAAFSFGDWAGFVQGEIVRALDLKSSSKLARVGDAPLLSELDGYVATARLTPEFAQMDPVFMGTVPSVILALSGSTRGAAVENTVVRRYVQAAVKVGPAYVGPLSRVGQRIPLFMAGVEDSLSWIESAPASLLQVGREALVEAQAIGYGKFQSDFDSFFTTRPNERDLTIARDEMRNLRTQLAAYPALASVKGDVVQTVYKNPKFDPKDLNATLEATSKLVVANDDLAREFLATVRVAADATEVNAGREWARALTPANAQLIRDFLSAALTSGFGDDALGVVRAMVHTRPSTADLQAYALSVALSKQFIVDEARRAAGSTSDTFYESDAKTLAKRIALEGFTAADVAALEIFAQVAGSDVFCDRKTVSYRLQCVGLGAISKAPGKMLAPEFQGRNVRIASQIAAWLQTLKPDMDHSSVRRTLKKLIFDGDSGPWAKCNAGQFDVNSQALTTAVQGYIQVMSDFSARFRAERAVSTAVDARCP